MADCARRWSTVSEVHLSVCLCPSRTSPERMIHAARDFDRRFPLAIKPIDDAFAAINDHFP